ncbi:MAG: FHA domain-containing protein [Terriglobia bacterium]
MIELTFELVGKENRWSYAQGEVRVGREPSCDLTLPSDEFPMVSGRHLVVRVEGDECWVEDLKSRNGTFLNGRNIQREQLSPGDILRLGADGPELRLQFVPPTKGVPTKIPATAAGPAPTQHREGVPPPPQPPRESAAGGPGEVVSESVTGEELSPGEEAMIEQKLNLVRNLLGVTLVLVLILGGVLFQQINRNRDTLSDMRAEFKTAVGTVMPELDQRLETFEGRLDNVQAAMDGMDAKIRRAEDRFVRRLDRELPRMLDRYIDKKLEEIRQEVRRGEQTPRR